MFLSAFFVLVFLCDAFSCVILLKIGIPIELEGESSMISVCMATYNGEKYLKDQLDSILKQIQSSDEVIISDDGSNDSTRYIIEKLTRIPVEVDIASEFRYRDPIIEPDSMTIIISQSGETADSLAALRKAQELGSKVLGIVNVVGSTIAREADNVLYTWAGPEISVATTKAYSTQLSALYLLAMLFGKTIETISNEEYAELLRDLKSLPDNISEILW